MKRIFWVFICAIFSTVTFAQQDTAPSPKKEQKTNREKVYCVALKNGDPVVLINAKPLKNDIDLKNGNKLTTTGTIIKKDGTDEQMKPGACIDPMGEEVEEALK